MSHVTVALRVLCEGNTESNFVQSVLRPHLAARRIFAKSEPLCRGHYGVVNWERLRSGIKADVGRSKSNEYVTTMIDLYKIGRYPGAEALKGESPYDRVKRIELRMREGLPNERFIPYIQVHEFEALVLVDCSHLPAQFPDGEADDACIALRQSIGDMAPELINDGETTAPSNRLIAAVPGYAAFKATAGPAIAAAIGLPRLRAACPHFHEWVTTLEELAAE